MEFLPICVSQVLLVVTLTLSTHTPLINWSFYTNSKCFILLSPLYIPCWSTSWMASTMTWLWSLCSCLLVNCLISSAIISTPKYLCRLLFLKLTLFYYYTILLFIIYIFLYIIFYYSLLFIISLYIILYFSLLLYSGIFVLFWYYFLWHTCRVLCLYWFLY